MLFQNEECFHRFGSIRPLAAHAELKESTPHAEKAAWNAWFQGVCQVSLDMHHNRNSLLSGWQKRWQKLYKVLGARLAGSQFGVYTDEFVCHTVCNMAGMQQCCSGVLAAKRNIGSCVQNVAQVR